VALCTADYGSCFAYYVLCSLRLFELQIGVAKVRRSNETKRSVTCWKLSESIEQLSERKHWGTHRKHVGKLTVIMYKESPVACSDLGPTPTKMSINSMKADPNVSRGIL